MLFIGTSKLIPINTQCDFIGNIYQLRKIKASRPNYYLLIQYSERTSVPGSRGSGGQAKFDSTAYAIMQLNNPDESVNYGDFEIPLYPAPLHNPPLAEPLPATVVFTLSDLKEEKAGNVPRASSKPAPVRPLKANSMPPIEEKKDDSVKDLVLDNIQPHVGVEIDSSDLIAIYVDSMRFIPNICGIIKVRLKGYTASMECNITEKQMSPKKATMYPDIESSVMMPVYNQKRTVKAAKLNPSTIIVGTLEMFDTFSGKDAVLGYFLINLFVEKSTGAPIYSSGGQGNLNEGCFQLPIFSENPLPSPFDMEKL